MFGPEFEFKNFGKGAESESENVTPATSGVYHNTTAVAFWRIILCNGHLATTRVEHHLCDVLHGIRYFLVSLSN